MIQISRFFRLGLLFVFISAGTVEAQISRIIHGNDATEGEWPWMVSLFPAGQDPATPGQGHFCGGALVSPQVVVTAAHCVSDLVGYPEELEVVVGRTVLSSSAGTRRAVKSIVIHPGYNAWLARNDIAVLKLASPVPQTPIDLVMPGDEALWSPGTLATIIGWGQTDPELPILPDQLQEALIPIQSDMTCRNAIGLYFNPASQLCAGVLSSAGTSDGIDSCYGDSGSPLMVPSGATWKLAGITSWGFECASSSTYGVYTRAAAFASWVYSSPPAPPMVREFPTVAPYAAATVGTSVTCLPGNWSGDDISYSYQWFRSGLSVDLPIDGAQQATYILRADDIDAYVYCLVTGRNASGVANGASEFVGPVYNPDPSPTVAPLDVTGPFTTKQRAFCKKRKCHVEVDVTDDQSSIAGVEGILSFQPKDCSGANAASATCRAARKVRILDATPRSNTVWSFSFKIKRAGKGSLQVRARDSVGNIQKRATRVTFSGS